MLSTKEAAVETSPQYLLQTENDVSNREDTPLGSLFVTALSQSSSDSVCYASWQALLNYLKLRTQAELDLLLEQPEVQHYIHRAVHYASKHSDKVKRLEILSELSTLFPEAVKKYAQTELPFSYSYSDIVQAKSKDKGRRDTHRRAATTPEEIFSYTPRNIPATFRAAPLKFNDLLSASQQVKEELCTVQRKMSHEIHSGAGRGEEQGDIARLGRPHLSHGRRSRRSKRSKSEERTALLQAVIQRPLLDPVLSSSVDDSHFHQLTSETLFPKKISPSKARPISTPDQLQLRDAYQTIEAFASGKLKSESESIYLNYANPWRQNPYKLTVVAKTKADPEHFIISKFGILRVYPDGTSDLQSFAEWLREASLFQILRQIPFLKHYRLKKAFRQWYQNVRFAHFACVRSKFKQVGMRYFATFAEAILKINNLSQELLSIPFHSLQPLGSYSNDTYMHCLNGSQTKFQQFLQRYFKYCKRVVTEVVESTQTHAAELENELQHQPFVSDLPLSVQKEKQQKLARDFAEISYRASRLQDFVGLTEHIVFSCLLAVARQGAQDWVDATLGQFSDEESTSWDDDAYDDDDRYGRYARAMSGSSMARRSELSTAATEVKQTAMADGGASAMLCTSIIIKESGEISTDPSVDEVKQLLLCPFHMITESLTSCVHPLTGSERHKHPHHPSRPVSQTSTLVTCTDMHSTVIDDGTPLHRRGSPTQRDKHQARDVKAKLAAASVRSVPPSMVPARQPKSLLRALKGSIVSPAGVGVGGAENQGSEVLDSERARSRLAHAIAGAGGSTRVGIRSGGGVQGTHLLMKDCFTARIKEDEVLLSLIAGLRTAVSEACETIQMTCEDNVWLSDVWKFVRSWQGRSKVTSMSAEELERTFNSLYDWQCLLESLPAHQATPHCLVSIESSDVVGQLLPRLTAILEQVKSIGVLQSKMLCERVLDETKQKTEMLTSKRYDLEGFAEYAHHLSDCQAFHKNEAEHIDYVLRVHSTLRRNGVKVPEADEVLSEELKTVWHTFEGVLTEAEHFVTTQTPMKAQGLQQSIESFEEDLHKFVKQVNEGKFVDPGGTPLQLIEELKQILEEAFSVRSRLLGLSKWKEAISGKPHNLSQVFSLMNQIVTRQEVWKYRKVFDGYERDWLKMPFKKLDIGLISEKVTLWLEVCTKLEETLPPLDPVLVGWKERLWEFQKGIPLLKQLASKALKVSHWYTIFASLGEDYDPSRQYTLYDFQLFNIYEQSDIIFEICHDAMQQEKLRGKVDKMQSRLDQEMLTISQSPVDRYPFAVACPSPPPPPHHQDGADPRHKQHLKVAGITTTTTTAGALKTARDVTSPVKRHGERITSFAITFQPPTPSESVVECLLFVENDGEVLISLENDIINVKILLASPHLGNLRGRVEALMKTLVQLRELMSLLAHCQDQWKQLLSLFSSVDPRELQSYGLSDLQQVTSKFQEVVKSIQDDPRLLSLLGKRRGQKGFRELQGDTLRQCFDKIQTNMESVHDKIKGQLERGCSEFPRLCFLAESDVLRVVSHSGSPLSIAAQISRLFPAVRTVRFAEMIPSNDAVHHPLQDSKGGYQLMSVEGWYGERLQLVAPLSLGKRPAAQWLQALEGALAYSLGSALADSHSSLPESLLGISNTEQQGDDDLDQWISSSLCQAVVLSLEMKWTSELYSALTSENPVQQLNHISSRMHAVLDTTAEVLRSERDAESAIKCQTSLQNIITILSHKLEVAKSLIEKRALTPESFEWRQHILYASDNTSIYNTAQKDHSQHQSSCNNLSVDYSGRTNQPSVRGSTTSVYSSLHSLKAGSSNALIMNAKLQGSTHSLVASSKSLLSSRNALLAAAATAGGGSDLQNSGTSSLALFKEPSPPMKCFVHCGVSILSYGFEYYGPRTKLTLSPISESCILSLINELARFTVPSLRGVQLSGKTETASEVARLLGRHCFLFSCSPSNKLSTLHRLITGALQSGSLLLLQDSTVLQPQVVASLGEWLASLTAAVAKAFSGKQSSIIFPVHSHQKNISDGRGDASTVSTPRQSRMSTTSQPQPTDKTSTLNKTSFIKHANSRQLSVIMSEQQLVTEAPSRQATAVTAQHTQKDSDTTTKEKSSNISVVAASPSQCSNLSQRSVSHNQHRSNLGQSRTGTRIDWYRLGEEQPSDSRSTISKWEWFGYGGGPRIKMEFNDQMLGVSPGFGCIFVGANCVSMVNEIPSSFKSTLRPMCVMAPDYTQIGEALLLSYGFTEARALSLRLSKVLDNLKCQLASTNRKLAMSISNIATLKQIVSASFAILTSKRQMDSIDVPQAESDAVAKAIINHFQCQMMCEEPEQMDEFESHVNVNLDPTSWKKLTELLNVYFPSFSITKNVEGGVTDVKTELVEAIKTQLKELHLQDLPLFEEKICQLHRSLHLSKCVVLSGVSGSGKTTCYRSLAGAYHHIRELRALGKQSQSMNKKPPQNRASNAATMELDNDYPCIDVTVLHPAVYNYEELFGSYLSAKAAGSPPAVDENQQLLWRDGILTRVIKQLEELENMKGRIKHPDADSTLNAMKVPLELDQVNHWLVLDGPLQASVVAALEMLAKGEGLTLPNEDILLLPRSCWLLLEAAKLTHFTPSLLSHSTLLHFSRDILSYEAIVDTWLDRAPTQHNLSAMSTETLATMIKQLLPETLQYLHDTNTRCVGALYSTWAEEQVYGVTETQCFVNLLSAVLERNAPKIDSTLTHTGTASVSSRLSSARVTESRASSAMLSTYSTSSMRVESVFSSSMIPVDSAHDVHDPTAEQADDDDELSECSDLEAQFNLSMQIQIASMLSFAYIWSLGAFVPFSELSSFSEFARDQIMQLPFMVPLPEEGSVFDYFLNLKQYQFVPWSRRGETASRTLRSSGYVALPEVERFAYIVDLYLSYGFDVMLVGQAGTGKTSFVENLIHSRLPVTKVQISPTLTPPQLQEILLERINQLDKRSSHRLMGGGRGATKLASSTRNTFFLDDIHLTSSTSQEAASSEINEGGEVGSFCCSPVLELARYAVQQHQLVDLSRSYRHSLNSTNYITSCTPWEYWKLPHQFSHSFNLVPFLPPSDRCLHEVFRRSVLPWLQQFPDSATGGDPEPLAKAVSAASVAVFRSVSMKFHPSPSTPYIRFTMHDLLRVYEGLLLLSPNAKAQTQPQFGLLNRRGFLSSTQGGKPSSQRRSSISTKTKNGRRGSTVLPGLKRTGSQPSVKSMRRGTISQGSNVDETEAVSTTRMVIRLWCHESTRVYLDKLMDSRDRMWFLKLLESCIKYSFCGIDFSNPLKTSPQRQPPGGGRRVRGGRARMMQGSSPSSSIAEGPSLEELVSSGIRADTLKQLMTNKDTEDDDCEDSSRDGGTLKKLVSLEQVTLKGEDLTGLLFAYFPNKIHHQPGSGISLARPHSGSSSEERERTPEAVESTAQPSGTNSYSELGDGQVMEILEKHLKSYNDNSNCEGQELGGRTAESAQSQKMDLVLFKGSIEHAARLCRSMSMPGSHSLLIGAKGSGRRSLIRLIAHAVNAKLYFLKECGCGLSSSDSLRQQLRSICISAAVDGNPTALVINTSVDIRRQDWENIYQLMNDGLCPGLFTSSELLVMSSKMQAGRMKKTVEGAQQAFSRAVGRQLHVFILWDTTDGKSGSLFGKAASSGSSLEGELFPEESSRLCFSSLYRACSYIDVYHPWTKQDYCDIALRWWQREGSSVKWYDWVDTSSHLEAVGNLAAHVHITTVELLKRSHCGSVISDLVSPKTFIECLKMTQRIATEMKLKEKNEAEKLTRALEKLNDVDRTIEELEMQLATLQPRLAAAEREVQQKMSLITAAKERYMAANERCKSAEETIKRETENMEQLSKTVEEKFNEVSPVYHSALEALISVQKNDILELMSYREPPEVLTPVFDALCMLFDKERTWEDCKQLLLTQNFFESLRFFDRDNVPLKKLRRLEKMIDRSSKFEDMEHGSQAILPLCTWLIALVDYHYAKMAVQPYRDRLGEAEKTLMDANRTFVEMRRDMMETRTALESTVKLHKESVQKQRSIELEIMGVQSTLESAKHLLAIISAQRERWDTNLSIIHSRIDSTPGHALLCSASVCYLSRIPSDKHQELLTNWLGYCSGAVTLGSLAVEHAYGGLQASPGHHSYSSHQEVVKIQKDFSLSGHLSEKDERFYWKQESVFPDQVSLERCLVARSACVHGDTQWPLIFDPHGQFEKYLSALKYNNTTANTTSKEVILPVAESAVSVKSQGAHGHHHQSVLKMKLFEPSLCQKLENCLQDGVTVLLCVDAEPLHTSQRVSDCPSLTGGELAFLSKLLLREFLHDADLQAYTILGYHGDIITIHPEFQLYLISSKRLEIILSRQGLDLDCLGGDRWELSNFCIIDGSLSTEGMQRHLQRFIITHEKPEYKIRYKSLLTDLILHQQQLTDSQERVLNCVLESEDSLLQASHLLNIVKESESLEASALEQISDTHQSMRLFDQQADAYKPLAEYATIILTAMQKLSSILKYFEFGIEKLEQLMVTLISFRADNKVPDNVMAINANVLYLKYRLLISVHEILQVYLFRRHQILLPLMVAMEVQLRRGKMTREERDLLSLDLAELEQQLDFELQENNAQRNKIPDWISRKNWCQVLQLQRRVQTFRRLSRDISTNSAEWKEYFDAPPYLLGFVPVYFSSCTLGEKLLLWKTFHPEKLSKVCKDFVVCVVGPEVTLTQSFSIDLLLPHTSSQVPILCMLPPPTPTLTSDHQLQGHSNNHCLSPLALLEAAASRLKKRLVSFALIDKEHLDEFLVELAQLTSEGSWVVIEHCHLYSHWQDMLQHILQMLCELSNGEGRLHPDFRLWILLPFRVVDADFSTHCLKVAFNHVDDGDTKVTALHSSTLAEDLKLIYPSQQLNTNVKWEDYESLLSKLQSFIPRPMTFAELTDLDPQQESTQSLLSLLYEELCVHNSVVVRLQASLNELSTFLKGDSLFTLRIGSALSSIRDNSVPASWKSFLPPPLAQCPELLLALNLLRQRIAFYKGVLEIGKVNLPLVMEPALFSNPEDMMIRILHISPANNSHLERQIDAKLLIDDTSPYHQNFDSSQCVVVFSDLRLHGACWDSERMRLYPLITRANAEGIQQNRSRSTKCSLVLTRRLLTETTERSSTNTSTTGTVTESSTGSGNNNCTTHYNCPVLLVTAGENLEATCMTVKSPPLLCSVPLPCRCDVIDNNLMTTLHSTRQQQQGDTHTPFQASVTDRGSREWPTVFLTCEWHT